MDWNLAAGCIGWYSAEGAPTTQSSKKGRLVTRHCIASCATVAFFRSKEGGECRGVFFLSEEFKIRKDSFNFRTYYKGISKLGFSEINAQRLFVGSNFFLLMQ
jgi:hypothetical protein